MLLANDVFGDERAVALQIGLSLDIVGFGFGDLGVGGFELALGLGDAGMGAAHVGLGGSESAAGVDGGNGDVDRGGGGVGLGAGDGGLGVLLGHEEVGRIELCDDGALGDELVFVHVDLGDLAGDAGADLDEMPVDLGVVGIFREGGPPVEIAPGEDENDDDAEDQEPARPGVAGAAFAVGFSGLFGRGWS